MATSMYVTDNPRRAKARSETNPFAISKYDHLEELVPTDEQDGYAPVKRARKGEGCRIWRTRRRADGKVSERCEMGCHALPLWKEGNWMVESFVTHFGRYLS